MSEPKSAEDAAREYGRSVDQDCLSEKYQPGAPVGECIYVFCGCHIYDAFMAGVAWQIEQDKSDMTTAYLVGFEKAKELEAEIDRLEDIIIDLREESELE